MSLTALDLVIMAIPIIAVLSVSVVMRKYLRSVADFLAASRCAGRYLISTSSGEIYATVILMMANMEMFSKTGLSMALWSSLPGLIFFYFTLLGIITYRYRETRALTFHQLLEIRYSKSVRVIASFLNVLSGLFNFGILPAMAARFFIYFCGLPPFFQFGGVSVQTYIVVMIALMLLSLYMTLSGGQISVMVTDALEGVISSVFYVVVAGAILGAISFGQVRSVFLSGSPGQSYIDPFDIGKQPDFNNWYVFLNLIYGIYLYRGGAWQAAFVASAKTAHESRMAQILGTWRGASYGAMATLASIGAFTLLHHHDFFAQQQLVESNVKGIGSAQLQGQMRMPMALGLLLASGIKGAFCAVAVFGILSSQGEQLHRYGSTFLQDVVLPLRKRPLEPREHIIWLKMSAVAVALFVCTFSIFYKPADYLVMISALIGAIYLGGIGVVVWGALYWRRATTEGALISLGLAGFMGIVMNIVQPLWPDICPRLIRWMGSGPVASYFSANVAKFPLNGFEIAALIALISTVAFVSVSLATCREPFNLEAMLHREKYRLASEGKPEIPKRRCNWLERVLELDENFTRTDRVLVYVTLGWTLLWQAVSAVIIMKTLFWGRFSANWFVDYLLYVTVPVNMAVGVITTLWFLFGVTGDMRKLFVLLKTVRPDSNDDGTVEDHHNLGETPAALIKEPVAKV